MAQYLLTTIIGLLLIVCIQAGTIPEEFKDEAPKVRKECMDKTGVALELIDKANNGDFVDDDKLKCYMKCGLDKYNVIVDNKIKFDKLIELAPSSYKESAEKSVQQCRDTKALKEGDICDLVFQFEKCVYSVMLDEYFLL